MAVTPLRAWNTSALSPSHNTVPSGKAAGRVRFGTEERPVAGRKNTVRRRTGAHRYRHGGSPARRARRQRLPKKRQVYLPREGPLPTGWCGGCGAGAVRVCRGGNAIVHRHRSPPTVTCLGHWYRLPTANIEERPHAAARLHHSHALHQCLLSSHAARYLRAIAPFFFLYTPPSANTLVLRFVVRRYTGHPSARLRQRQLAVGIGCL